MLRHPAHLIALSGGAGLAPLAPGTFGSLLAFPIHWWIEPAFVAFRWLAVLAGAFLVGIWACGRTGADLGVADHGALVWDETVAFALVLFFTPAGYAWQAAAFVLFRAFDIIKPPPIRYYDRHWHGGLGVMFDDLLAAFYALLVLAIAKLLIAG
jgi:phosphatidylglycerophosphatase A